SAPIEAMHRIIQLTPSVIGAAKRFRELMAEAIAQFNGGSLPAAVAMLELADLVIAEKKLDPTVVDRVRSDAVESISSEQLRKDTSLYPMDEMGKVVDRIVAALARIATPNALLAIARHGMKPNPLLGDTRARLASLSQHDLSFDTETVNVLVRTIREDLPTKVFGKLIATRQQPLRLIEALSSTRSEVVEKLFAEIVEKFGDHDVGRAAAAALANLASLGKAK